MTKRLDIETLEVAGFRSAFEALGLPKGRECRTQTDFQMAVNGMCIGSITNVTINEKDMALIQRLIKAGDEHAKVLRGIVVYAKITAPVYFFNEEEVYTVGHQRLCSSSMMHINFPELSGEELEQARDNVLCGEKYTKIDSFSYQTLRRIFIQRHNHRLLMWHTFCEWITTLPYAKELILAGLNTEHYEI